ncbi:MAG: TolC family protein [Methyloceanibacter sp.]|uniref:TolC family protein n=1 Tax=Methyloceanibacter sp. TaxID=1965321 RepID=UPI003D6D3B1E
MFSQLRACAAALAAAAALSACQTFSPDGGMGRVAAIAGDGLNQGVVRVRSPEDAAAAQDAVARLLHAPLSADAAVQIALYNNLGLQAAYNRLGIAEAVAVQSSRPPLPIFAFETVSTPLELDFERKIIASILSLATWPARSKIAGVRFEQAQLQAAQETLNVGADARKAYWRAVAAREILAAVSKAAANADASAKLAESLKQSGALNTLEHARRQVFAKEMAAQVTAARQQVSATQERLTRVLGLWGTDLSGVLPGALPPLVRTTRSLAAVEQEAMDRRVDLAIAKLEAEALARSYGLTRKTRFINVVDASGISKTQKDKGEGPSVDGGGFDIEFVVPIYDFGRARVREAEERYMEALNLLGERAVNARSEAREAYGAYAAAYKIAVQYQNEVLPLRATISRETELQYNAMQVDAFALLQEARADTLAKVASIEAKRNFWLAYTDLSVAVLGGGDLSPAAEAVMAADTSGAAGH